MSVALFAPFGTFGQEAGIIYLLASYLRAREIPVTRLSCNGVFSLCDRDRETSWSRDVQACMRCIADQRNLALWGSLEDTPLSPYLLAAEVERTRRWMIGVSDEDLLTVEFDGGTLAELCFGSFESRFGTRRVNMKNVQHERYMRRLMLSAARMKVLSKRLLREVAPAISLVASGQDFLSRTYLNECEQAGLETAVFQWNSGSRYVDIRCSSREESLQCEILLDDVASMRREVGTWPEELVTLLEELMEFLGLQEERVAAPAV